MRRSTDNLRMNRWAYRRNLFGGFHMQRRNAFFLALSLFCFSPLSAIAQTSSALTTTTARDRRSVNVTGYNANIRLVRETRGLNHPTRRVALRFADVAALI